MMPIRVNAIRRPRRGARKANPEFDSHFNLP
jgi:hypothetical protein